MTVGDVNDVFDKIAFMEAGNKGREYDTYYTYILAKFYMEYL